MNKIPASAAILTYNSEKSLRRALESIKDFDEIIVCDGGSKDKTLDMAREFGATIIFDDPKFKKPGIGLVNYGGVRNQQLAVARNKWFFFIDSDEYLNQEAIDEIRIITESAKPEAYAFWQPRKYVVNGKIIDCATTYPNKQMRLFHKDHVTGFIKEAHEKIELKPGTPVGTLKHFELVPMDSLEALKKRWRKAYLIETVERSRNSRIQSFKGLVRQSELFMLYIFRHAKILLFCRGNKMPFDYEMARHRDNLRPISDHLRGIFRMK
jgi:glycosyltransferase involved in cell wall biosynthesis